MNKFIPNEICVYMRVSTRAQVIGTNGLDNQKKICEKYIETNNFSQIPIKYFTDVASSYINKNTLVNLNKMIRNLSYDTLILVGDVSRLGRNSFQVFSDLRKIKQKKSFIVSIEDELTYGFNRLIDKKFYHKVIDAENSSDLKSEKIKNRINIIKSHGGYIGRKSFYGTQIIKKKNIPYIYKNFSEINIINKMKLKYNKTSDFNKVAKYLNKKKLFNRNNVEWTDSDIKKVLLKYYPAIVNGYVYKNDNSYDSIALKNIPDNSYNLDSSDKELDEDIKLLGF